MKLDAPGIGELNPKEEPDVPWMASFSCLFFSKKTNKQRRSSNAFAIYLLSSTGPGRTYDRRVLVHVQLW